MPNFSWFYTVVSGCQTSAENWATGKSLCNVCIFSAMSELNQLETLSPSASHNSCVCAAHIPLSSPNSLQDWLCTAHTLLYSISCCWKSLWSISSSQCTLMTMKKVRPGAYPKYAKDSAWGSALCYIGTALPLVFSFANSYFRYTHHWVCSSEGMEVFSSESVGQFWDMINLVSTSNQW